MRRDCARSKPIQPGRTTLQTAPADAAAEQIAVQRKLLASQVAAHAAKLGAIDGQMQQRQAEQATIRATIAKLEASIPLIRARFDIRDEMSRKQLGSKIVHLENKQALVESEKELLVQQSHLKTADAALAVLGQQKAEASAEFHKTVAADLAEAERKVAGVARGGRQGAAEDPSVVPHRADRRYRPATLRS